jgi:DtxR family Mn-dependent transcriptional regulator
MRLNLRGIRVPVKQPGKEITKEREDYLKTIYHLQHTESPVRTTSIARAIGVEPASVTGVIKRLAELGLVEYAPYRGVELTGEGTRVALEIIRHHRLIELYLIEALDYTWDEVHDEAERLEHVVSPLFIERISAALGHPGIDPHGSPIPTEDGRIGPLTGVPLTALTPGQGGRVVRVNDDEPDLLRYLGSLGIRPGVEIAVLEIAPFGGPIRVKVDRQKHALGPQAAANIYVELASH